MLLIAAVLFSGSAFAQNITVTGSVKDAATGEPVIGYVQLKGQEAKVFAEIDVFDGTYSISVPKDGTLIVQASGYKTAEIAVAGRSKVDFSLEVDAEMLEGTVFVGYGSAKKIGNIVGSVTTVDAAVIKNAPAVSALDLLQGQVAGLQVLSTGGVAGDNNISMKIHGTGSLTSSSEPLFIVDGAQSSSSAVMAMNPNDIASVTILKDASSTSIYGAQGANGVVYITTKAGSFDTKATVRVSSQYGISTLANMQFYENMMTGDELKDFWIHSGIHTADEIYKTYTSKGYTANTQWHKIMQRFNNPQYQNDLTVEGGSGKVAYLIGASQFHQNGNTWGNYFDRYTLRSNIQAHPNDWLKVGLNINGSLTKDQSNENWGSSSDVANYTSGGLSFMLNPLYPAIDPKTGELYEYQFPDGTWNPYYYNEVGYRNDFSTYRLTGSAFVEITPLKNLVITSRVGTDSSAGFMDRYLMPSAKFGSGTGMVQKRTTLASKSTITNTIEYSLDLGDNNHISALVGQEGINYIATAYNAFSNGQTDDRMLTLNNGKQESFVVNQSSSAYRFFSLFAHADYNFKDTYFVDFTVRNDKSSRFGIDRRSANFWAAGAMWKLGNEEFIRDIDWINSFDLKVNYGTQGNASVGNYSHLGIVGTSSKYAEAASMVVAQPSNKELTWENQALFTAGFDARIFDMADVEILFYDRKTTDMLMSVPYPYTSGFTSASDNVGTLDNKGIDISLGIDIINTRDAYVNFHTTFNYNAEKVTELFNGLDRWDEEGTGVTFVVGQPVMFYAPLYAGVDPADGMPMWYLPGENPDVCTRDPKKVTKDFDEVALLQSSGHRRHEPINGGFGVSARWKNFSMNVDFAFDLGKTLINNDMYFYANPNQFANDNQSKVISDFWTEYNTDAKYPDWRKGVILPLDDDHLFEDASFCRLKTLQLGYNVPIKSNKVVKGLMVTLTGRNLLTFTKYTGMDPEIDQNLTLGIPGNTKQVLGGIEIKF